MMILVIGFLCLKNITVREYPNVSIPALSVSVSYSSASAEVVETSVTGPLEDSISGISGVKYITSDSKTGSAYISIIFEDGVDTDRAMIDLQNAVNTARARLPNDVDPPEIIKGLQSGGVPFFAIALSSDDMSFVELAHYAERYIKNSFRSVKGVATAEVWAPTYTMHITLDPKKLYVYGLNVTDVINALKQYNISLPIGKFQDDIPATLDLDLKDPEEFRNVSVASKDGRVVYIKDIAEVVLGPDASRFRIHVNGKPGVVIGINKNSDSNPLDVASGIEEKMENIKSSLPDGMKMAVTIDSSKFIQASLENVYHSIFEAIILVLAIVYLFLRNIRATIIPLVTIPFSLIGAVAIMQICGMSINILTLLAMVMAIGLVVDDAIIVLENIARHIESGMKPFDAAIKGSSEIGFAIIAMTLTLASVYMPILFIKGLVADLFLEFAVALAGSVLISGIVALTLSPMMCSVILKHGHSAGEKSMHQFLERIDRKYAELLYRVMSMPKLVIWVMVASLALSLLFAKLMPQEIVPKEDRSLAGVFMRPIPGENMDDLEAHAFEMEKIVSKISEGVESMTFMGPWGVSACIPLKDFKDRKRSQQEIVDEMQELTSKMPSIDVFPWGWESGLPGMDSFTSGMSLQLVVSSTGPYKELSTYVQKLTNKINESGKFIYAMHNVKFDSEGVDLVLDKNKMARLNLSPQVIANAINAAFSGNKTLRFKKDDVLYGITIDTVNSPWSLDEIYVVTPSGVRVSVGSIARLDETISMSTLPHYNQVRAATITAAPMPFSSMESLMPAVMKMADEILPDQFAREWTGAAEASKEASGKAGLMFVMAIIFIYAILAVQFDNFLDPLIIMFTVPLACSGALMFGWFIGISMNIYTQIGLITLVGLISKHGILIIEFANKLLKADKNPKDAVTHAAIMRLRPILMTTGAMILGSLPLVFSSGAGSEARSVIGVVLVFGLGVGTFFTLFVLPSIYCWAKLFRR